MLYLIGLGLGDVKDITVKGLEIVKKAHKIYLEAYTSILMENKEKLVQRFIFSIIPQFKLLSLQAVKLFETLKQKPSK